MKAIEKIIQQSYQLTTDGTAYKLKNAGTLAERKNILDIMKKSRIWISCNLADPGIKMSKANKNFAILPLISTLLF